MELSDVFNSRYSARKYSTKRIEKDKLMEVLEAGRIAPTAVNKQPQRFYIVESYEAIKKLDSVTVMRYGAPTVIVICSDMDEVWYSKYEEGYDSSEMDISIVTTYMMLKATELGLGTVWVRAFDSNEVKKVFNMPENIKPICMLPIGYVADDCVPNEKLHYSRRNLDDEVTFI